MMLCSSLSVDATSEVLNLHKQKTYNNLLIVVAKTMK